MTVKINLLSGEEWRSENFRVDNNNHKNRLEQNSKNFIFNRGAGGLRQINKVNKISPNQLLKNCYKRVA